MKLYRISFNLTISISNINRGKFFNVSISRKMKVTVCKIITV